MTMSLVPKTNGKNGHSEYGLSCGVLSEFPSREQALETSLPYLCLISGND